jgi:hypothetical protein
VWNLDPVYPRKSQEWQSATLLDSPPPPTTLPERTLDNVVSGEGFTRVALLLLLLPDVGGGGVGRVVVVGAGQRLLGGSPRAGGGGGGMRDSSAV